MTRKDRAITNLKQMCSDGRYLGSGSYAPLEVLEDFNLAIKALEQEPILDKIRAEIEDLDFFYDNDYFSSNKDAMFKCNEVLAIIDKYKAESEG